VSQYEELQTTVAAILDLLIEHGDTYVVDRLRGYTERLQERDQTVVQTLLSEATGSMGSLRDRYLCPTNGDHITVTEERAVNIRLTAMVERLEQQARAALNMTHVAQ
jgi:hypothetical protein